MTVRRCIADRLAPACRPAAAAVPRAAGVVHYVRRTGQTVVLADAAADELHGSDPYVLAQRPRSLLCLPVQQQGRLLGVLYLETPPRGRRLQRARASAGVGHPRRAGGDRRWRDAGAPAGAGRGGELGTAARPDRQRLARPAHAAGLAARLPRAAGRQGRRPGRARSGAVPGHRGAPERAAGHADRRAVRTGQARLQGHGAAVRALRAGRAGGRRGAEVPARGAGAAGRAARRGRRRRARVSSTPIWG